MRRTLLALAVLGLCARAAAAADVTAARLDVGGRIKSVRASDLDGDGRADLVLLVERKEADQPARREIVLLRSPGEPAPGTFFRESELVRIPCSGDEAGERARAGAVAIGRFGPKGEVRLRFLGPVGTPDVGADGRPVADSRGEPSLLERGPGEALAIWDAVADVDGDGRDEVLAPGPDGAVTVAGVAIPATETASRSDAQIFVRSSRSPRLSSADVDGDGVAEILRVDGTELVVERVGDGDRSRIERADLARQRAHAQPLAPARGAACTPPLDRGRRRRPQGRSRRDADPRAPRQDRRAAHLVLLLPGSVLRARDPRRSPNRRRASTPRASRSIRASSTSMATATSITWSTRSAATCST